MDPFECYNFDEAVDNETGFTKSQTQGYCKVTDNLRRADNLIYKSKQ